MSKGFLRKEKDGISDDYAYTCHTGKVRTNNEDNFWCCGVRLPVHNQGVDGILAGHTQHWKLPMLAVFDGMGGESCGEMAASAAVEALGGFYEENKKTLKKEPVVFLTGACENMNEAVCRYSNENCIRSMGTTMALLSFSEKAIYACNLGDRPYLPSFSGEVPADFHGPCDRWKNAGKSSADAVSGLPGRKHGTGAFYRGDRLSAGKLVSDLFRWSDRHAF